VFLRTAGESFSVGVESRDAETLKRWSSFSTAQRLLPSSATDDDDRRSAVHCSHDLTVTTTSPYLRRRTTRASPADDVIGLRDVSDGVTGAEVPWCKVSDGCTAAAVMADSDGERGNESAVNDMATRLETVL